MRKITVALDNKARIESLYRSGDPRRLSNSVLPPKRTVSAIEEIILELERIMQTGLTNGQDGVIFNKPSMYYFEVTLNEKFYAKQLRMLQFIPEFESIIGAPKNAIKITFKLHHL